MLAEVIDTQRYPLTEPGGPAYAELVAGIRTELGRSGCSVLDGFLRPAACDRMRAESAELAPQAYADVETVNVYNTDVDAAAALPDDHPARRVMQRGNAFVARDLIPAGAVIARLYADPAVQRFVAECFGLPTLHELADPFSALVLNVVEPGRSHPWHFDTNEFTVSMLTREPEAGGVFEYCPGIRSPRAENLDDVRDVLDGAAPQLVRRLELRPGDLQLFQGRYALHRVSPVAGATARHSAIFAYSERPGVIGSVARTRQLFGRVSPAHLAVARGTARVDQLLD